jgi:Flp pilus assembly protein TadD
MPIRFIVNSVLLTGAMLFCLAQSARANEVDEASALLRSGQQHKALQQINAYLESKPTDPQARFLKGVILTEQANTDEAIKIFTALTADYPKQPEPYNNLAVLYAGQGNYEKAVQALEMAIHVKPNYAVAEENIGDLFAFRAGEAYERAAKLESSVTIEAKLAMIKQLLAKDAKARKTAGKGDTPAN